MICPICGEEQINEYRPFCSKRCADIDLGKWMRGSYAIPSKGEDDQEELISEMEAHFEGKPHKGFS